MLENEFYKGNTNKPYNDNLYGILYILLELIHHERSEYNIFLRDTYGKQYRNLYCFPLMKIAFQRYLRSIYIFEDMIFLRPPQSEEDYAFSSRYTIKILKGLTDFFKKISQNIGISHIGDILKITNKKTLITSDILQVIEFLILNESYDIYSLNQLIAPVHRIEKIDHQYNDEEKKQHEIYFINEFSYFSNTKEYKQFASIIGNEKAIMFLTAFVKTINLISLEPDNYLYQIDLSLLREQRESSDKNKEYAIKQINKGNFSSLKKGKKEATSIDSINKDKLIKKNNNELLELKNEKFKEKVQTTSKNIKPNEFLRSLIYTEVNKAREDIFNAAIYSICDKYSDEDLKLIMDKYSVKEKNDNYYNEFAKLEVGIPYSRAMIFKIKENLKDNIKNEQILTLMNSILTDWSCLMDKTYHYLLQTKVDIKTKIMNNFRDLNRSINKYDNNFLFHAKSFLDFADSPSSIDAEIINHLNFLFDYIDGNNEIDKNSSKKNIITLDEVRSFLPDRIKAVNNLTSFKIEGKNFNFLKSEEDQKSYVNEKWIAEILKYNKVNK